MTTDDDRQLEEPAAEPAEGSLRGPRVSRRRLLGGLGAAGAAGLAAGTLGGVALADRDRSPDSPATHPFAGAHQAGVATPRQSHLVMAAFDLLGDDRDGLRDLLISWSEKAERMTRGDPADAVDGDPLAPPGDNGEALGLPASRLTVTFGFGRTLFERDGSDRLGLAAALPSPLVDLPPFANDALDPARSGGDMCVQACADDPQVAFHAMRTLARVSRGVATTRWSQLGFLPSNAADPAITPRNLLGFKDGTNNIPHGDAEAHDRDVWVGANEEPAWMRGGSFLVTRRIRMLIEVWDRSSLDDQERTIGRRKVSGAPMSGVREHDALDLTAKAADGELAIPIDAHVRLASAAENDDARMLRRSYSFADGVDPSLSHLETGLFFIGFMRDPRRQFIPIQTRLSQLDALNEYIQHVGSGVFAVPPGASRGGFVGESLFA